MTGSSSRFGALVSPLATVPRSRYAVPYTRSKAVSMSCRFVGFSAALRLYSVLKATTITELSRPRGWALLTMEASRPFRLCTWSTTSAHFAARPASSGDGAAAVGVGVCTADVSCAGGALSGGGGALSGGGGALTGGGGTLACGGDALTGGGGTLAGGGGALI